MASRARIRPGAAGSRRDAPACEPAQRWTESEAGVRFIRKAVPMDGSAPAVAQQLIAQLGSLVSGELMAHAQLLMSELVRQRAGWSQGDLRDELWIDISLTPARLRIAVIDPDRADVSNTAAPSWELQLVAELADRWGVRHDATTTVWLELDQ